MEPYSSSEPTPILAKKCPVVSATKSIAKSKRSSGIVSLEIFNLLNFFKNSKVRFSKITKAGESKHD